MAVSNNLSLTIPYTDEPTLPYKPLEQSAKRLKTDENPAITHISLDALELPERHEDILAAFQKEFPQLTPDAALLILKTSYTKQKTLQSHETFTHEKSTSFPYQIVVHKRGIHVLTNGEAGKGGNGVVASGPFFSFYTDYDSDSDLRRSPSRPRKFARKQENRPFIGILPNESRVKSIRKRLSPEDRKYFCKDLAETLPQAGETLPQERKLQTTMPLYQNNFAQIDWTSIPSPVNYLIKKMKQSAIPLRALHEMDPPQVHRDIKEGNIMISPDDEVVKLIDFETTCDSFTTIKRTQGTVAYLNPRSFGSPKETLKHQRERLGVQRPTDDMTAYDTMGIRMILKLCKERIDPNKRKVLSQHGNYVQGKQHTLIGGKTKFTDEELEEFGEKHPFRAHLDMYRIGDKIVESVKIFPSPDEYKSYLKELIEATTLTGGEKEELKKAANFFIEQKFATDEMRLTARETSVKLTELFPSI